MMTRGRYMIMDYCPRGAIMETDQLPRPPLDASDCRRWFADSVLGLQYLHFQGVIHHDLKPDNILVNMKGAAVISDFGVSRASHYTGNAGPGGGASDKTKGALGTPLYNAPEKFCADASGYDGAAADVWALGVTLHAMVFGELPYPAATHETPEKLEGAITAEEEWQCAHACADADLLALLSGMMRKRPTERFTLHDVHDAPWDRAVIAVEEDTGGGSRDSWKKIVVSHAQAAGAVAKCTAQRSKSVITSVSPGGPPKAGSDLSTGGSSIREESIKEESIKEEESEVAGVTVQVDDDVGMCGCFGSKPKRTSTA